MATSKINKHKLVSTFITQYNCDNNSTMPATIDLTGQLGIYDEFLIVVTSDINNGTTVRIPTGLSNSVRIPIWTTSMNRETSYSSADKGFAFQGNYEGGILTINWVTVKGWSAIAVRVYGLQS